MSMTCIVTAIAMYRVVVSFLSKMLKKIDIKKLNNWTINMKPTTDKFVQKVRFTGFMSKPDSWISSAIDLLKIIW